MLDLRERIMIKMYFSPMQAHTLPLVIKLVSLVPIYLRESLLWCWDLARGVSPPYHVGIGQGAHEGGWEREKGLLCCSLSLAVSRQ